MALMKRGLVRDSEWLWRMAQAVSLGVIAVGIFDKFGFEEDKKESSVVIRFLKGIWSIQLSEE